MIHHDDDRACAQCGTPLAAGTLRCPACGRQLVGDTAVQSAREAAGALVRQLGGSPYFKDGGQLSYTLRGHVRGFLEDPSHPLSRELLRFLAVVALEGGAVGWRHLLAWADGTQLRPRAPSVSAAVAYAHRRHVTQLRALAGGADAQALQALRAGQDPAGLAAAEELRNAAVARVLAEWCAERGPPSPPHSM